VADDDLGHYDLRDDPDVANYGDIGSVVNAGVFSGSISITAEARRSVAEHSFDAAAVRQLRAVYELVPAWDRALALLRERHVVALVGEQGSSRRITAVNLAAHSDLTPRALLLDPEDLRQQFRVKMSTALLLDLADLDPDTLTPTIGEILLSQAEQLGQRGSALIIVATSRAWHLLGMQDRGVAVDMSQPPDPVRVFRKHLSYLRNAADADYCAARPEITTALAGAQPGDAAELAGGAAEMIERGFPAAFPDTWLADVVEGFHNWTRRISDWFSAEGHGDGYLRSLLLATAALEGASASAVFAAANELAAVVGIPRLDGAALTGPGAAALIKAIDAEETAGVVRFTRPKYATSVLDYVWADRPHLRDDLQRWLISAARRLSDGAPRAASALTGLAIRHREPGRITDAVVEWAKVPAARSFAVEVLTLAAVDDNVGRTIRRAMYYWAARVTSDEGLASVVARVCGGDFGLAFPSVALTRLRHLANHESDSVHVAVIEAISALAADTRLRSDVLVEVVGWLAADQPPRRVATARRAFITLAALRDERGRFVMLLGAADSEERQDALADGWRVCLRNQDLVQAQAAQSTLRQWLDAAAQHGRPEPVVEILARSCRSSIDVGVLSSLVRRWSSAAGGGTVSFDHAALGDLLLSRIERQDPLRNGVFLAASAATRGRNV
jgi:hypothetical protein